MTVNCEPTVQFHLNEFSWFMYSIGVFPLNDKFNYRRDWLYAKLHCWVLGRAKAILIGFITLCEIMHQNRSLTHPSPGLSVTFASMNNHLDKLY